MSELLTSDEAAAHLRLSERKLYELIAAGTLPCTKVTGRWLFPKAALDRWVLSGLIGDVSLTRADAPPIVGGSQDPLLEWALRESGCGLASLPEGSEAGLRRLTRGEVTTAAIHMHRLDDASDENANADALMRATGLYDGVLISFARREQGLLVAAGNPLKLNDIRSVATARARMTQRPEGAGAQLLQLALIAQAGLKPDAIVAAKPVCATGPDVAQSIRAGRSDCGIATRSVAGVPGVDFIPLLWERFDLALRQRDYFQPGPQALFAFLRTPAFAAHAAELTGYDVSETGAVRHVN
jgi:excisionase family DNA binding protein